MLFVLNFNTSYVVIKRGGLMEWFIMLPNFNTSYVVIKPLGGMFNLVQKGFQYILCCY